MTLTDSDDSIDHAGLSGQSGMTKFYWMNVISRTAFLHAVSMLLYVKIFFK